MENTQIVLQHILVPAESRFDSCHGLFYRFGNLQIGYPAATNDCNIHTSPLDAQFFKGWGVDIDHETGAMRIAAGTTVSFATYFNMLPVAKWLEYTYVDAVSLQLEATGEFELVLKALTADEVPHWFLFSV